MGKAELKREVKYRDTVRKDQTNSLTKKHENELT